MFIVDNAQSIYPKVGFIKGRRIASIGFAMTSITSTKHSEVKVNICQYLFYSNILL